MATMVVLAFKDETSAEQMRDKLVGLQKLQLIKLADAAVVVPVSYTHLTLPTNVQQCRYRWSPYH